MDYTEAPNFSILRMTKGKIPNLPFVDVKEDILGKNYDLSLVFTTTEEATRLHKEHEGKDGPANILSFGLDDRSGEMFIHLGEIRKEARSFGHGYLEHLLYMFIHGCVHLLGYDHGAKMTEVEERFRGKFL